MRQNINLPLVEIVGSPLCMTADDGQKVHDRIATALKDGHHVNLSFLNVTDITPSFMNAVIGQLYGEFSEEIIRTGVQVSDIAQDDLALLKRVVETATPRDPCTRDRKLNLLTGGGQQHGPQSKLSHRPARHS